MKTLFGVKSAFEELYALNNIDLIKFVKPFFRPQACAAFLHVQTSFKEG